MAGLALLIGFPLVSSITGCRQLAADGVYSSDQLLYQAEMATVTSYDILDTFVKWEATHRASLTRWPDISKAATEIRKGSPQWFATAYAMRDAYKNDPSPQNKSNLETALRVIRQAMLEATGYMTQAASAKPKA